MIAVTAHLTAREGREAEFEHAFLQMVDAVRANEPGNRLYQLARGRDGDRRYVVLELYADEAALEAHRTSDHYKAGGRSLRELVESPPEVKVFDAVE
ncbi:MAG: antibiotic biosynthesis monooxygenase [Caulobacteraceae bacterium]|nr:antibiotic biosynthesis monooxygenase [Caulobacter sp.]